MSLASHIVELNKKHQQLDKQIKQLQRSPGYDTLKIAEFKKQKLRLKDEIERLMNPRRLTTAALPAQTLDDLAPVFLEQESLDEGSVDIAA